MQNTPRNPRQGWADKGLTVSFLTFGLLAPLQAQNAVILGNANFQGGHAENGVWIRGNVTGSQYELNPNDGKIVPFYLGGDNNIDNFFRYNGAGNNHDSSDGVFGDLRGEVGKYQGDLGSMREPNWNGYAGVSNTLSQLVGVDMASLITDPNNVKLTISEGLNVFNVNASSLSGHRSLDFLDSNGQGVQDLGSVVINVSGDINSWGWSVNYDPNQIVWNFVDAETINVDQRHFKGSLLAPNATVTQSQNIDGFLLAENWVVRNSVELHDYSVPQPVFDVAPIPEPSAILLTASAALVGLTTRRRRLA